MADATVTGDAASIQIAPQSETLVDAQNYGIADFSISFDRDTVEQEQATKGGNMYKEGSLSIDGSFTNSKFASSGNSIPLDGILEGTKVTISGAISGGTHLGFFFASGLITSYNATYGDASTITEASIDFTVLNSYQAQYDSTSGWVTC